MKKIRNKHVATSWSSQTEHEPENIYFGEQTTSLVTKERGMRIALETVAVVGLGYVGLPL
ncbi:MAG: hypothetical protein UV60_C0005G0042, partial [Parcubacteria group bacterium GW2011_GWA2_43_11]